MPDMNAVKIITIVLFKSSLLQRWNIYQGKRPITFLKVKMSVQYKIFLFKAL